jgi:hypothetical protein
VYDHEPDRCFDVGVSDDPQAPVVITLRIRAAEGKKSFSVRLARDEAHQLGHHFLSAANPSRLASDDD